MWPQKWEGLKWARWDGKVWETIKVAKKDPRCRRYLYSGCFCDRMNSLFTSALHRPSTLFFLSFFYSNFHHTTPEPHNTTWLPTKHHPSVVNCWKVPAGQQNYFPWFAPLMHLTPHTNHLQMPCSQSNSCHTTPHQQTQSACAAIREVALRHVDGLELANGPDYAYLLSASSSLITYLLALSSQNRVVRARTSSGRARRSSHSQIHLPKICDFCGETDTPNWRGVSQKREWMGEWAK